MLTTSCVSTWYRISTAFPHLLHETRSVVEGAHRLKLESLLQYMDGLLGIPDHPDYSTALNGLQVGGPERSGGSSPRWTRRRPGVRCRGARRGPPAGAPRALLGRAAAAHRPAVAAHQAPPRPRGGRVQRPPSPGRPRGGGELRRARTSPGPDAPGAVRRVQGRAHRVVGVARRSGGRDRDWPRSCCRGPGRGSRAPGSRAARSASSGWGSSPAAERPSSPTRWPWAWTPSSPERGPTTRTSTPMESGIHLLFGGHYATETFGVRALARHVVRAIRSGVGASSTSPRACDARVNEDTGRAASAARSVYRLPQPAAASSIPASWRPGPP